MAKILSRTVCNIDKFGNEYIKQTHIEHERHYNGKLICDRCGKHVESITVIKEGMFCSTCLWIITSSRDRDIEKKSKNRAGTD